MSKTKPVILSILFSSHLGEYWGTIWIGDQLFLYKRNTIRTCWAFIVFILLWFLTSFNGIDLILATSRQKFEILFMVAFEGRVVKLLIATDKCWKCITIKYIFSFFISNYGVTHYTQLLCSRCSHLLTLSVWNTLILM